MKYALNLSEEGRILSATYEQYAPADSVLVDTLPEGDITHYRYKNGQYIYDPRPKTNDSDEAEGAVAKTVWDELDEAYQSGYNDGYAEGVNSVYDQ